MGADGKYASSVQHKIEVAVAEGVKQWMWSL